MIFVSPYLKGGKEKNALSRRTKYIATREGVELLKGQHGDAPATPKQKAFILRLLETYPQIMELGEYEDYAEAQTMDAAAELIDRVWEQFVTAMDQRENFLDYVAHRPGVQKEGDHGLWDKNGKVRNLEKTVEEVAGHEGIVWTPVVSIRREDAERLGYTTAENWRALVNACSKEIADGYKISLKNLRWYAALHEKEHHIHIHMIVFSSDPKEGYLSKQGIRDIKAAFATHIFEQDLVQVYARKTEYRNELQRSAEERMEEFVLQMKTGTIRNHKIEQLTAELAERLKHTKGRKVYGYLPPPVKRIVDEIVDELSRDERVAAAYALWQEMQEEVYRTYSENLPERIPLSRQKEFKTVRNMVIREALKLTAEGPALDAEDEEIRSWNPEAPNPEASAASASASTTGSRTPGSTEPATAVSAAVIRMLRHMGRIFEENATADTIHKNLQIDRKRRRQLQEKRLALGHKPDDHEEQGQVM